MPKPFCRTNLYNKIVQLEVCRTFSGRGMGMNITAHTSSFLPSGGHQLAPLRHEVRQLRRRPSCPDDRLNNIYIYIYICTCMCNGSYSSVVRVSASGGGGPGFNPYHVKLSGSQISPVKRLWRITCPPPEQTPGKQIKNLDGRLSASNK